MDNQLLNEESRNEDEPKNEIPDQNSQTVDPLIEKIEELKTLFLEKISQDEMRNKFFEKLSSEHTQYRENFIFENILKRLYLDSLDIYDRIGALKSLVSNQLSTQDTISHLESIEKNILQLLRRQGIEKIEVDSDFFNDEFQEAKETVPTENPEENMKIEKVLNDGFLYNEKIILRPERVIVKKIQNNKKGE